MNKSVKKINCLLLTLCLLMIMAGCSKSALMEDMAVNSTAFTSVANDMYYKNSVDAMGDVYAESVVEMGVSNGSPQSVTSSTSQTANNNVAAGQKLIRRKTMRVETIDFDNVVSMIQIRVAELGGYIESSSVNGTGKAYNRRSSDMVIRIPGESLDIFVGEVGNTTTVLYSSETTTDVTLDYIDMESHVKALRTEQEALMNLLEKAESLDDIITIQSQLTRVRYEIESYESRLRSMDNLVTYSTVNLTISEVERETNIIEEKSFFDEAVTGLKNSLYDMGEWLRGMALWFIVSLPYLIVWAVVITIIVIMIRKFIKKRKNKKSMPKQGNSDADNSVSNINDIDISESSKKKKNSHKE